MTTTSRPLHPHDLHPDAILVFHHSYIHEGRLLFGLVAFGTDGTTPLDPDVSVQANAASPSELNTLLNRVAGTLSALAAHGRNMYNENEHHRLVLLSQLGHDKWHWLQDAVPKTLRTNGQDANRKWLAQNLSSGRVQVRDLLPTLAHMVCARRENHVHTREAFGARSPTPCGHPKYDAFQLGRTFFEVRHHRRECLASAA